MTRALPAVGCAALLVVGLLAVGLLGGTAVAGDALGLVDFAPQETDAQPGETVTVDATLRSHGGYGGEGVASVNQTVAYDPAVLSVVDVRAGPWLEQGEETDVDVDSTVDEEAGRVTVDQVRDPVAGGATGEATTVSITFRVAEDAPPSDAVLQYEEVNLTLETGFPQRVVDREGLVRVDGGGEERVPIPEEDEDDSPGVTTPVSTPADGTGEGDDVDDADDQSGFGVAVAVAALLAVVALRRRTG